MKSVMHWQKQSQTKGKQHLDVFQTTYYLINSIITSAFCRHENSVIPKLTNFNSTLLTTSDSELNPLPVLSLFKEALKWTKLKLPLFNWVYASNINNVFYPCHESSHTYVYRVKSQLKRVISFGPKPFVPEFHSSFCRYFWITIRHPSLYRYSNLVVSFVRQLNRLCNFVNHFVALFPAFESVTTQK